MPSRPGEFHPEPLTEPDLTLSRHPARATARRLPPSIEHIKEALAASRFLIVVCSAFTPRSKWVAREIEIFNELGRSDQVLALLTEGEPGNSFPTALLEGLKSELRLGRAAFLRANGDRRGIADAVENCCKVAATA